MNKKIMLCFLFICFVTNRIDVYAENLINYNNIQISENEYNNLLNLGFDEEEILYMEKDEYLKNKDITSQLIGKTEKYFKTITIYDNVENIAQFVNSNNKTNVISSNTYEITKEEYEELNNNMTPIMPYANGVYETTGKKMVVTMSSTSNNRYRFKNTVTWKKMPKNRYNELFGIFYDNSKIETISDSHVAKYQYSVLNSCTKIGTSYQKDYSAKKYWNTKYKSYYMSFPLKEDKDITYYWDPQTEESPCVDSTIMDGVYHAEENVTAMKAYMYYDVAKISNSDTIDTIRIVGEYQHAYKKLSLETSISFGIDTTSTGNVGINITPKYDSYYDNMKTVDLTKENLGW